MHILIAPNAFKNSLTADLAAEAIRKGLEQSRLPCSMDCFPVGDGGDGTGALLVNYLGAEKVKRKILDPIGRKINSSLGITTTKDTAIIELADASGLRLLKEKEYDPLHANTEGTGQLIRYALEQNVKKIILCIGGSATVDAGMGIISALGAKFYNAEGKKLKPEPASLIDMAAIDLNGLDKKVFGIELVILCDVENRLPGENGSAAVFGPQKGASKKEVKKLERFLTNTRDIILKETGHDMNTVDHGGAAGGVAAGLYALLNAKLVKGIDYFLEITAFDKALSHADLLITGEGSIDEQTLQGKAPFGVAIRARQKSIPVIGLAGKVPLKVNKALQACFDVLLPISHEAMNIESAMKYTAANLERTATMLGNLLAIDSKPNKNPSHV